MDTLAYMRSFRVFGIAMFDLVMATLGLYAIAYSLVLKSPMLWALVWVLPVSVVAHVIKGTPTMLNYYLGLSTEPIR